MSKRIMGVSEARRLLPQIVTRVANEGGRVDITRRGEPMVAIVRASDLGETHRRNGRNRSSALSVEFAGDSNHIVDVIRELRGRTGNARKATALGRRRPQSGKQRKAP